MTIVYFQPRHDLQRPTARGSIPIRGADEDTSRPDRVFREWSPPAASDLTGSVVDTTSEPATEIPGCDAGRTRSTGWRDRPPLTGRKVSASLP